MDNCPTATKCTLFRVATNALRLSTCKPLCSLPTNNHKKAHSTQALSSSPDRKTTSPFTMPTASQSSTKLSFLPICPLDAHLPATPKLKISASSPATLSMPANGACETVLQGAKSPLAKTTTLLAKTTKLSNSKRTTRTVSSSPLWRWLSCLAHSLC